METLILNSKLETLNPCLPAGRLSKSKAQNLKLKGFVLNFLILDLEFV